MKTTKKAIITMSILLIVLAVGTFTLMSKNTPESTLAPETSVSQEKTSGGIINTIKKEIMSPRESLHPMAIESLRQNEYPGGQFTIKQTLSNGTNYRRMVASYESEGLEIDGLLTVPLASKPEGGYPAVMFIHGHIPPAQYSTINSYPTYQAALARGGFVTFKPDLRGHGTSEGEPNSAHYSPDYVIDTLNALAYLKEYEEINPNRIGYWGHSNGGEIGLRTILVDQDIKAASFWAGVVGSYEDMYETYIDDIPFLQNDNNPLVQQYGLPSQNPEFWNALEPYKFLNEISIPIELQHGTSDISVPIELSLSLKSALETANKDVTYIGYPGDDHNIGQNSSAAWQRSIDFFHQHL